MPKGKLSSQTGHAYEKTLEHARINFPDRVSGYRDANRGGSKGALEAKTTRDLITAFAKAREAGLPCLLVVDEHHVMPPFFDGNPIITALGVGPCTKAESRSILKKFRCL